MFEYPENFAELSIEEIEQTLRTAIQALKEIDLDAADAKMIAEAEGVVRFVEDAQAELTKRSKFAAQVEQLRESGSGVAKNNEEEVVEEILDEILDEEDSTVEAPEEDEVVEMDKDSALAAAAANAPEVRAPKSAPAVITAAADVSGFAAGQALDSLDQVGQALINRMRSMPSHRVDNTRLQFGASVIRKNFDSELVQGVTDDWGLVQKAGTESRLKGGSLVAAGGWCSPSETLYDLCQYESTDGLVDVPEIQVNRGGIRYSQGPDFSDIYANGGFDLTEDQVAGGTPKSCSTVPCPSFEDIRLDAVGVCIEAPLLTNAAYPELVRRYVEGSLVAHQHRLNAKLISDMRAAAGAPIVVPDNGTLLFNLDHIEWQAVAMRYAYRLPVNDTIEVIAPLWLKTLVRAELGRRTGVEGWAITDAQIDEYFSARNLAVQFVYGFDDLTSYPVIENVPSTASVVMYPSGTWVKGTADVINIDAVYDSTNLQSNLFTAVFVEEGFLALQRCTGTLLLNIPVSVTGKTAAASLDAVMGTV